ncbi:MAG: DegV family protein [Candidatus Heimdallarchaeaceae archaeon]
MNIKIITDSTSNLTPELAKKYEVDLIPAYAIINEKEYLDDGSTPAEEFYRLITISKSAKTSQPSPQNVWDVLENNKDCDHLLMIHVSPKLSGTMNVVTSTVNQFRRKNSNCPEITIFDSKGSSYFLGAIVLKAVQLLRKGEDLESIIQGITHFRDNDVQVFLMVTDLTHIFQSGRIGRLQYYIADILHAYPILTLVDGGLKPVAKDIGTERTCKKLLEEAWKCYNPDDEVVVWMAETIPREENKNFRRMIEETKKPKIKKIEPFLVGNAIVCHTGPTVMGIITARNFDLE